VHLHWVTDGFLTIETISKIKKPIVWSLCDAWAFSGAEHYATKVSRTRSQQGYQKSNRHPNDSGFDVDRWTWNRKKGNWQQPMQLLPASGWLTQATRESALMGTWPITQIPHIVDTSVFTPQPQRDKKMPVLLFLASAGIHDRRKGWNLLEQSLDDPALATKVHVVVVGPEPTEREPQQIRENSPHQVTFHVEARGDQALIALYALGDITVVPSREDNMPITAMESQSCGTPVVAFRIGGLPDIVNPLTSGYLAEPENPHDLAQGIEQVLQLDLRDSTRTHALATWSPEVVVPQLLNIYSQALAQ
jgi:glycosyltransferase involved in cell wall biosynthesis